MHILDGALATPVLFGGAALTVAGIGIGLNKLTLERIPAAGVLSASFFVASLIHVPIGVSSVHLILNGLAGLILGWAAFPALFVGLLLQAVFFGFGGITVLGVNAINIAGPAVLTGLLFRQLIESSTPNMASIWAGFAGAFAIALTTIMVGLSLALSGEEFIPAAYAVFWAHIPIMVVEGLLTGAAVYLVRKVRPDLFLAVSGA
ncbi:cobalt transporter CbiM [Marivivens donghaensis]|uniref:Cobalt transporter CbiM n=1 Tax=Marivivens donghaensis TaxID=1699413 RepID=A0ABX0VUV3_9RHOB|nr:cobalt transporter CbiM [Marivivens donghaensis]NIY71834.1 cobalt transporter CbiM [Marivivens donghaensis]